MDDPPADRAARRMELEVAARDWDREKQRYKGGFRVLLSSLFLLQCAMLEMVLLRLVWTDTDEAIWRGLCLCQAVCFCLHLMCLTNGMPLERHRDNQPPSMRARLCLIEQLLLLHWLAWYVCCVHSANAGYILFALVHARSFDLVRHWWHKKTFLPMIVS